MPRQIPGRSMSAEEAYTDAIEATEGLHGAERERVIAEHMEGYGYRVPRQSTRLKATLARATARTRAKHAPKPHPPYAGSFERLHGGASATDFHRVRNDPKAIAAVMAGNDLLRKNREALRKQRRSTREADYAALFGADTDTSEEESVI